ncbi:DUF808 domain-containing protein [Micrococcus flavus]|uniref:Putative DNA repair protein MutK n=1 Tax=Micrococcus flavus TaxID=384602 RepID=A0A4Y8WXE1_9MICC|nr:DUF808 domain-containing protein [Micrococcus flavus]MBB4882304.1 putative DNA repair protein MutK [Micrococcus flavus]TFH99918.1 DUF808 domain-containing protein [Micrococcus flavus]GGK49782.1 ABC transporter [Micrococcus flavus]
MSGLVALLDDVAALARLAAASVDDVAAGAAKASAKAAGVVVDDAAVTPQYMSGAAAKRELPMIWRITKGSLRNKLVFILPALLIIDWLAPWLLPWLLIAGGTYLSYEGAHKVWGKLTGHHASHEAPAVEQGPEAEDKVVRGAITTDFILSAEIMVISMNEVADQSFWLKAAILAVVAVMITVVVYGAVALIVKMDDIGLHMNQNARTSGGRSFGAGLVKAMPVVLGVITAIGTVAMLWVGGHIVLMELSALGLPWPYDLQHEVVHAVEAAGGVVAWLVETLTSAAWGLLWGTLVVGIMAVVDRVRGKKDTLAH